MLFWKMNGLGNDYVFIDVERFASKKERLYLENNIEKFSQKFSDRHFGIGSDGVVLMMPSICADMRMRIFNADGSEGKMCGNALRCVCKYLYDSDIIRAREYVIETASGERRVDVEVIAGKVVSAVADMGLLESKRVGIGEYIVDVGNKHYVIIGNKQTLPPFSKAKSISDKYDANVEFASMEVQNKLDVRVYERGSGETLACGTGAAAAAYAAVLNGCDAKVIDVNLKGGLLKVNFDGNRAYVSGAVALNYIGEVSAKL